MAQGTAPSLFRSSPKDYLEFDLAGKEVLHELKSRLTIPMILQGNLLLRGPWEGGKPSSEPGKSRKMKCWVWK